MDAKQRRVKALGYGEQRIEALGQQPYLDFECKDGTIVRVPHPLRLDDPALGRVEALQRGDGLDREPILDADGSPRFDPQTGKPLTCLVEPPQVDGKPAEPHVVRLMKAVLGEDDYEKLVAHGLTARELNQIWQGLAESADSEDVGDPKGKRS